MPTITVIVDHALMERMAEQAGITWRGITRQALRDKIAKLELMAELSAESESPTPTLTKSPQ